LRAETKSTDKPNLLFTLCDELRADTMEVYGNNDLRVPNLNKLASESAAFQYNYVSQPVCTPSRATILTGLWPHTCGCTELNIPLKSATKCVPELVADSDYRTGYFGKWHLGDEVFAQHGFEEWISIEDMYHPYFSAGRDKNAKSTYWHYLKSLNHQPGKDGYFSRNFTRSLPFHHSKPKFLQEKACDFLRRRQKDPFILYVSFLAPHMPFTGPFNALYDPEQYSPYDLYLPSNMNAMPGTDDPLRYRLLAAQMKRDPMAWRKLTANYWGLITEIDLAVGSILKQLEDLDLAKKTLVVFTTDHGEMMGSHQLSEKSVMYQEAIRVPLLMRAPWMSRKGQVVAEQTSDIDLVPTVLDLLGKPKPQNLPGRSLRQVVNGLRKAEDIFVEWNPDSRLPLDHNAPDSIPGITKEERERVAYASMRTVITPDGWKLNLCDHDKSQLFNLQKDPGEKSNLFYSGSHRSIIQTLTGKVHRWQAATADTLKSI
jgi:arylsulfatase A-like enzyme